VLGSAASNVDEVMASKKAASPSLRVWTVLFIVLLFRFFWLRECVIVSHKSVVDHNLYHCFSSLYLSCPAQFGRAGGFGLFKPLPVLRGAMNSMLTS
jgi:hypothetical protein